MAKEKIEGGATLWARKTIESEIFSWKPDKWFKIWFYIINKVNWKDGPILKRGQGYFTYKQIMDATKTSRDQVKHCLEFMRLKASPGATPMLATQKAPRGMIVTVLNYHVYQDIDRYRSPTKSPIKARQKPDRSPTISKERKKGIKGIKKDPPLPPILNEIEIIMLQWNEFAEKYDLALIKGIEKKSQRYSNLNARMKTKNFDFKLLLTIIENSPFLLAQTKEGFRVFFDWVIKPSNYQKIIEGNYLDRKKKYSGISEWYREMEDKYGKGK